MVSRLPHPPVGSDPHGDASLPKRIHALWLQGLDAAPPLVRMNLRRWKAMNPGYAMTVLDQADVDRLLADVPMAFDGMRPQALSNIVRTKLLLDQGGVWVDATLYPVRPLDAWLPDLVRPAGFFAFARPHPDRLLSNWFLAASPGHPLVQGWWTELLRFWTMPRELVPGIPDDPPASVSPQAAATATYPYFTHHYLFHYMLTQTPDLAALWARCPVVDAEPPHLLQRRFRETPKPGLLEILRFMRTAPLHKLNWRDDYPVRLLRWLR